MSTNRDMNLDAYLASTFQPVDATSVDLPVGDEAHLMWWRQRLADGGGTADSLVTALPQFQVPIAQGASTSDPYVRFVRRGEPNDTPLPSSEIFVSPETVSWSVVEHPAGALPVLTLEHRADFERAFRALGARCEPIAVGPNVHALYISGLPSPIRLAQTEHEFLNAGGAHEDWPDEMRRRQAADATSFHDRLILLHPAPYGGINAAQVGGGMGEHEWLEASMQLRLEHEFTHHATHRLLGSYRLHVHDEVLADLMGFTKALGRYDAALFLRGLGIDGEEVSTDARLLTYVKQLNPAEIPSLVRVLRSVSKTIEGIAPNFVGVAEAERLKALLSLAGRDLRMLADAAPATEACPENM